VDYTLDGTSSTAEPVVAPLNGPVTAEITLPDSASLSVFHKLSAQWDLLADLTWTGWSDFDDLPIRGTINKTTRENWEDILRYSLGATWHMNEQMSWRGGIAYDEAPVSDIDRTPRIPDGARTWVAFGGQYRLSRQSVIDFGYAHLFVNDPGLRSSDNGTTLNGEYDSAVDIFSAQYTLNF
jgi:long-chain fatty acid transport protein